MIKLLDDSEILKSFSDICGEKLQSLAISYGMDKLFCTFWQQIDEEGEVTAVICKFGTAVTVSLNSYDRKELLDFLAFIGFDELVCDESLADEIGGFDAEKMYAVEKSVKPINQNCPRLTFDEISAIYKLLAESNTDAIEMGDFESWYVDISHRIRHGGAVAVLTDWGCGIGLLSEDAVVVNGIAVAKAHRGKGYGKELLSCIENFGKSRSMAFCLGTELGFYNKCGYVIKGNYSLFRKGKKDNV